MRLRGRIDDASTPYVDQFTVTVKGSGFEAYMGRWSGFRWPTDRWRTLRESHMSSFFGRPGRYRVRLYATDPAGNRQIQAGESVLIVKRRPGSGGAGASAGGFSVHRVASPARAAALPAWLPAELRAVVARLAEQRR